MPSRWTHAAAAVGTTAAAAALFASAALASGAGTDPSGTAADVEGTSDASVVGVVLGPTATPPASLGPSVPVATDLVAPNGADLFQISSETDHGLPQAARRAYRAAARTIAGERPDCDLPWELLAGIGRVETDHGRFGGSRLGVDGISRPLIRGIALDGVGPVAAIPDSDDGRLDGDRVWDRAVGPMQFIPTTWASSGRDGDGDGRRDPNDLDDAALATAGYLCPASGTILDEAVMRGQVFAYNHSDYYVDLVIAFAIGYHTGVFDIPAPPVEPEAPTGAPDPTARPTRTLGDRPTRQPTQAPTRQPEQQPTRQPTQEPSQQPTQEPTRQPTKEPEPTQEPTQEPPRLATATGAWTACAPTWCLTGVSLDLGPTSRYALRAAEDFDADGTVETNQAELDGLVGRAVTVTVRRGTREVYLIDGLGYRNADGSFAG